MASLVLMTHALTLSTDVVPALGLLAHHVRLVPADAAALVTGPPADVVLVDARTQLAPARTLCRTLAATGIDVPVVAVLTEGGLIAVQADWAVDDVVLDTAGPAEVETRLRLAIGRSARPTPTPAATGPSDEVATGELVVDEHAYTARLRGNALDLTYKEFELLKHLARHPGRVFTREALLQEVWGYDYFGGTRTVDVHVRRLRAKLGSDYETLIGTVRNVGYRFVPEAAAADTTRTPAPPRAAPAPAPAGATTDPAP